MANTSTHPATVNGQVTPAFLMPGECFTAPAGAVVDGRPISEPEMFTVDDVSVLHDGTVHIPVIYPDSTAGCVELTADTFVLLQERTW